MGFDITYHPITESEILTCYFDLIADPSLRQNVYDRFNLTQDDRELVNCRLDTDFTAEPFNSGVGMALASAAGFYRKYWYIRGGAFSFILEEYPEFARYCRSWDLLLPKGKFPDRRPHLQANYMVGCYLSEAGVLALRADAKTNKEVRTLLHELFSHGRLPIFMQALDYAAENKTGLIEASEIVEPDPFSLENSGFRSNPDNCDMQGVSLYVSAATEQVSQAMAQQQNGAAARPAGFWQWIKRWF
ncbi:hypothetical protein RAS12_16930 [Achromobacter seleniivolatilans]|uniref:Uncharacterized protein n=1 Tax=Achromobacter seleniivolatilans TaxID=3047478 RepID=A0ABY9LV39_9BURK|nr:hypothetical protein [Achromobacter sp. R39]WMD18325.1 hypothetical protein RAS12_16930 [Achromobacter sp. R39]